MPRNSVTGERDAEVQVAAVGSSDAHFHAAKRPLTDRLGSNLSLIGH